MNLKKFKKKFEEIKLMGWIENLYPKNKNGGAGNTMEKLLGISENNLKTPDMGDIELKTTKKTKSGTITLFTHDKGLWKLRQKDVLEKYGKWIEQKGRYDMYYIHELKKPSSNGIRTNIIDNAIVLTARDNIKIFEYSFEEMANRWNEKVKKTILINFKERKNENGKREYRFEEYKMHAGIMTSEIIKKAWEDSLLIIETSMHVYPGKAVRNHGTKMRAKQENLEIIYNLTQNS